MACPSISEAAPGLELQEALLREFKEAYLAHVQSVSREILGSAGCGLIGACRRWICAPVAYTLENRRNFFRSAFSMLIGPASPCPEAAPFLGASVEVAWSCALVLDDVFDASDEREGRPAAHRVFGKLRCLLAVPLALAGVFVTILFRAPGSIAARSERTRRGFQYLWLCALTQVPGHRIPSLAAYRRDSLRVNISHHWALLSPLAATDNHALKASLELYANHLTISGKMRNDLLDYCGGSTERDSILDDFKALRATFPVIVLWNCTLQCEEREALRRHFSGRGKMSLSRFLELCSRHNVPHLCMEQIQEETISARRALLAAKDAGAPPELVNTLHRWTYYVEDVCREKIESWPPAQGAAS